jgi:hypothetical protein
MLHLRTINGLLAFAIKGIPVEQERAPITMAV